MNTFRNLFLVAAITAVLFLVLALVQSQENSKLRGSVAMKSAIIAEYETAAKNAADRWHQEFVKCYESTERKGVLNDRVEKIAKKICALEGIKYVSFGSYQMSVHWANMFTWDEFKGPIIEILKAEFPDPASPPASPKTTTGNEPHSGNTE